jgi:hypothetical protein
MPRLELADVRGLAGLKEAEVRLQSPTTGRGLNRTLRVAVVNGLNNAKTLIKVYSRVPWGCLVPPDTCGSVSLKLPLACS